MASDLSERDPVAIQIDGLRLDDRLSTTGCRRSGLSALGVPGGSGQKHPLGVVEGATENAATARAVLDTPIAPRSSAGWNRKAATSSSWTVPRL